MEQRRDYDGLLIVALLILMILTACDHSGSRAVFYSDDSINTGDTSAATDASPVSQAETVKPKPNEPTPGASPRPVLVIPSPPDELFQLAIGATVRLLGGDSTEKEEFDGSGIILGQDDNGFLFVLTVWHVAKHDIESVEVFSILSEDPIAILSKPELVSKSERRDLALVKVKATKNLEFESVKMIFNSAKTTQAAPEFAYSVGCSDGKPPTLLPERITGSAKYKVENSVKNAIMWTTESPQKKGRSGGALLDVNGSLLGVALGFTLHEKKQGFYCHSSEISDYLIDNNLQTLLTYAKSEN